jgi:hypothetical protein
VIGVGLPNFSGQIFSHNKCALPNFTGGKLFDFVHNTIGGVDKRLLKVNSFVNSMGINKIFSR